MDEDAIAISALSHYIFCPRRCALIHIEQIWDENRFTAEGRIMHERVHEADRESRGKVRIESGVWLRSLSFGLVGIADVVEFHRQPDKSWLPFPVEYKRGKSKKDDCDTVQLCAQALCLEEMLGVEIGSGALFYGKTRRRKDVVFDDGLRTKTEETAHGTQALIASGKTPPPIYQKKCDSCSLLGTCMPKTMEKKNRVADYLSKVIHQL